MMDPGLIWYTAHAVHKGVLKGCPNFNLTLSFPLHKILKGAHPTHSFLHTTTQT